MTRQSEALTRRQWMQGGAAAAAWAVTGGPLAALAQDAAGEGELLPFLDVPEPRRAEMIRWDRLEDWTTPEENFFVVSHYGVPELEADAYRLRIGGLVDRALTLSLEQIKSRPKSEYVAALECGGNGGIKGFEGAIGNARWGGTPLGPILREAGIGKGAQEVVFFGSDEGTEELRRLEYRKSFSRSLRVEHAMADQIMLLYEMNGEPLTAEHGFPLRLGVPGWYGVAWVKWLKSIEVIDRRWVSRFMSRDYVTIRGEKRGEETIWRETLVGPINLKSMVGRVVRRADGSVRVNGAAWTDGVALQKVELQIDDGPWREVALIEGASAQYAWKFWSYDWREPAPGEHTLVSRAIDSDGRVQPTAEDPQIAMKRTYWEANQQVVRKIKV